MVDCKTTGNHSDNSHSRERKIVNLIAGNAEVNGEAWIVLSSSMICQISFQKYISNSKYKMDLYNSINYVELKTQINTNLD